MGLVTTTSQRLATKPNVGTLNGHVDFPGVNGNSLSTPSSALLNIAGNLCLVVRVAADDWTPPAAMTITGKWTNSGNQRGYRLDLNVAGTLSLFWSTTGADNPSATSTVPVGAADGTWKWIGIPLIVDNGASLREARFWLSDDGVNWTQLGATVTGAVTSIFASSAPVLTSGHTLSTVQPFAGKVEHVSIRSGTGPAGTVGGTEVYRLDATRDFDDAGAHEFTATTGQPVTVMRTGTPATILVPSIRTDRGRPAGAGDWRIVYERLDGTGSIVGEPTEVGTAVVGTLDWTDITEFVRGTDTRTGADEPNGRPKVGEHAVTLDNESGEFNPWETYGATRPGVLIRAGLASLIDPRAGGWLPLFGAIVDDWPVEYEGSRSDGAADSWVTVVLVDTITDAAGEDDNALGAVVGLNDKATARLSRLAAQMAWPYGVVTRFTDGIEPGYTLQSTNMSANRAEEMYLTADSTGTVVRSDATGALLVTTRDVDRPTRLGDFSHDGDFPMIVLGEVNDVAGELYQIAYEPDSVTTGNNRDGIFNRHRWARVGGTMQTFLHRVSMGRFRRRTSTRTNLLNTSDANVLQLAQAASDLQARTAMRVEAVTVDADEPEAILAIAAADLDDSIRFIPAVGAGTGQGRIRSIARSITPLNDDAVMFLATFAIDFYAIADLPGAMLDPAPR